MMLNEKNNSETDSNSDDEYRRGGVIRRRKRVSKGAIKITNKINIKINTAPAKKARKPYTRKPKPPKAGSGYAPVSEIRSGVGQSYSSFLNPQSAPSGTSFRSPQQYVPAPQFTSAPELLRNPSSITDIQQLNERKSIEAPPEPKTIENKYKEILGLPYVAQAPSAPPKTPERPVTVEEEEVEEEEMPPLNLEEVPPPMTPPSKSVLPDVIPYFTGTQKQVIESGLGQIGKDLNFKSLIAPDTAEDKAKEKADKKAIKDKEKADEKAIKAKESDKKKQDKKAFTAGAKASPVIKPTSSSKKIQASYAPPNLYQPVNPTYRPSSSSSSSSSSQRTVFEQLLDKNDEIDLDDNLGLY